VSVPGTVDAAALYRAVAYVLDRIQDMPDVRYYCGSGTQIFYELIQAEAAYLGKPLEEIERVRKADTQPEYRKMKPRVIYLEEKIDAMRRACSCGGAHTV
jgi:hypothetical protein